MRHRVGRNFTRPFPARTALDAMIQPMLLLLVALTASLGLVVPDATLNMVKISSMKGGGGQLPLSMCRWPLWIVSADRVTKLSGAGGSEEEAGWVDPISFEQLWLPEDLPLPSSHLAVSLVIKVRQSWVRIHPTPSLGPSPTPRLRSCMRLRQLLSPSLPLSRTACRATCCRASRPRSRP